MDEAAGYVGASTFAAIEMTLRQMLAAPGTSDSERVFLRIALARLYSFEWSEPDVRSFDPLTLAKSSGCSAEISYQMQWFPAFFLSIGYALNIIALAYERGEGLPADAVFCLMGGVGLAAPRLSLLPIQAWTSEYLVNLGSVAQAEELSGGVERYLAAQKVFDGCKAVLRSEDLFSVVSPQKILLHKAIEEYLLLRESGVVTARR